MNDYVCVGKIVNTHGIKGELRILSDFELKDKVLNDTLEEKTTKSKEVSNTNVLEAITALQVLGYSEKHIKDVINRIDITDDKVEDIIKKVLKEM